jgi:hypothetical protein
MALCATGAAGGLAACGSEGQRTSSIRERQTCSFADSDGGCVEQDAIAILDDSSDQGDAGDANDSAVSCLGDAPICTPICTAAPDGTIACGECCAVGTIPSCKIRILPPPPSCGFDEVPLGDPIAKGTVPTPQIAALQDCSDTNPCAVFPFTHLWAEEMTSDVQTFALIQADGTASFYLPPDGAAPGTIVYAPDAVGILAPLLVPPGGYCNGTLVYAQTADGGVNLMGCMPFQIDSRYRPLNGTGSDSGTCQQPVNKCVGNRC